MVTKSRKTDHTKLALLRDKNLRFSEFQSLSSVKIDKRLYFRVGGKNVNFIEPNKISTEAIKSFFPEFHP
jgi:hypothetical protein